MRERLTQDHCPGRGDPRRALELCAPAGGDSKGTVRLKKSTKNPQNRLDRPNHWPQIMRPGGTEGAHQAPGPAGRGGAAGPPTRADQVDQINGQVQLRLSRWRACKVPALTSGSASCILLAQHRQVPRLRSKLVRHSPLAAQLAHTHSVPASCLPQGRTSSISPGFHRFLAV
jgi:hypothetical protein